MPDRTKAAAEIIAAQARLLAARFSVQIPPSVRVSGGGDSADIEASAPPAYPNETGAWHPVYGHRDNWVKNAHRPFLAPAADMKATAAAEEIANVVDDIAHEAGFAGD